MSRFGHEKTHHTTLPSWRDYAENRGIKEPKRQLKWHQGRTIF
jgi:hypothetical protein